MLSSVVLVNLPCECCNSVKKFNYVNKKLIILKFSAVTLCLCQDSFWYYARIALAVKCALSLTVTCRGGWVLAPEVKLTDISGMCCIVNGLH